MSASLNNIVDITVDFSAPFVAVTGFDLGLIISEPGSVADFATTFEILTRDNYASRLTTLGFNTSTDLNKAVSAYFAQESNPSRVAVAGKGTTENVVTTIQRIRALNNEWYGFCFADNSISLSGVQNVLQSFETPTLYYWASDDYTDFGSLSTYKRIIGIYSNDDYAAPAVLGMVSGLSTLKPNSAFTVAYKRLIGVTPEDVNDTTLNTIAVTNHANVFCKFGNSYNFFYPGKTTDGYHIDEMVLIDAVKTIIQQYVVNGLTSVRKIPQTESGVNSIINMIQDACKLFNDAGYIDSGIWKANPVGNLNTGDSIENGFYVYANSVYDQSQADREARKSPNIYVALLASGAIEHVVISVYVNR